MSTDGYERFDFVEIRDAPAAEADVPPPGFLDEDPLDALRDAAPTEPQTPTGFFRVVEIIGQPGRELGRFEHPHGIGLDPQGNLYVAEAGLGRVQRISPEGEVWGYTGGGTRRGEWVEATDVAADARGMLYVLERGASRIQKIGADARYHHTFGTPGKSFSQLWRPSALALDSRNSVWVADTGNDRIVGFEPNGRCMVVHRAEAIGGLRGPLSVSVTRGEELLICDAENCRLVVLGTRGEVLGSIDGFREDGSRLFGIPVAAVEDPFGAIWAIDGASQALVKLDRDGRELNRVGPVLGPNAGTLRRPTSLAMRPDGDLYVCDSGNGRVLRFGYRV